jgi:hypothetical protein
MKRPLKFPKRPWDMYPSANARVAKPAVPIRVTIKEAKEKVHD